MRNSHLILAALTVTLFSFQAKAQDSWADIAADVVGKEAKTARVSTLWNGDYDKPLIEVVLGYVNKSWICTYDSGTQREDFFGDPDDKYLHGFQIGGLFTPSFDWGLGLRTGLFLEFYRSRSKWITSWCTSFSEADLYIPVHASFRIPFDEEYGLNLFGGIGFQWAMSGRYFRPVGYVVDYGWRRPWPWAPGYVPVGVFEKQVYGYGWPKQVNWQAECGLNLRLKMIGLSFTYSFGLVDHGIESIDDNGATIKANYSRQDKMQATLSFIF